MDMEEYADKLPAAPADLVGWVRKRGLLQKELLLYKMDSYIEPLTQQRKLGVLLTCTACRESGFTDKIPGSGGTDYGFLHPDIGTDIWNDNTTRCPYCGRSVIARHTRRMSQMDCEEVYPLTVSRMEDKLVLQGWCVRKWFQNDGKSGYTVWPYEAYVVEQRGMVRLTGYTKCLTTVSLLGHWEQRKVFYDNWGSGDLVYPWKSRILNGSTAENSKLNLFLRATKGTSACRPVTYLRFWQRHPAAENLVMQGAGCLLGELMKEEQDVHGGYGYYGLTSRELPKLKGLNWKEVRPSKILGLTKEELNRCTREQWSAERYRFFIERKAEGTVYAEEELNLLETMGFYNYEKLQKDEGLNPLKAARYLQKQHRKDGKSDIRILMDTWRMGNLLGYDMKNPDFQLPPHLMRLHDRFSEECRKREEERRRKAEKEREEQRRRQGKKIKKRYEVLSLYAWEKDGILIRPVRDYEDLKREGTLQHHCVATYAEAVADGKSAIFLIRKCEDPDTPWYTLELDERTLTVRQNRGSHNCDRTPDVTAFEEAWLEHIRKSAAKARQKHKRETAA
jgi:hypothetical protein